MQYRFLMRVVSVGNFSYTIKDPSFFCSFVTVVYRFPENTELQGVFTKQRITLHIVSYLSFTLSVSQFLRGPVPTLKSSPNYFQQISSDQFVFPRTKFLGKLLKVNSTGQFLQDCYRILRATQGRGGKVVLRELTNVRIDLED